MFGTGNPLAEIAIIEDFPLQSEYINKKLYLGGTSYTYEMMLSNVGLKRDQVWTTAFIGNWGEKLREFYYDKPCTKLKYEYTHYIELLAIELQKLPNLKVIMPVGNGALQVIAGVNGLSNWRGSVISASKEFCPKYSSKWKVIPTYSPRNVNTEYPLRIYVNVDLKKALKHKNIIGIVKPIRTIIVDPAFTQARTYLENIFNNKLKVSTDIETRGRDITCISFAINPWNGISIPFYHTNGEKYWKNIEESNYIENLVKKIINSPDIPKILQNAMYDFWVMGNSSYEPKGLYFDTMFASHCMFSELEKNLGLLTSVYTDEPYYKFERTLAKKQKDKEIKPFEKEIKNIWSDARKLAKKRATTIRRIKRTVPLKPTPKRVLDLENWHVEKDDLLNGVTGCMKICREKNKQLKERMDKFEHDSDITYWTYNTKDALVTYEIYEKQEKELKTRGLWDFFQKYYISMFPVAYDISMHGLKINEERRYIVAEKVHKGLEIMRQEIYKKVGYEFNTESPIQLSKVLFSTLKLPIQTYKGKVTTDAKALDRLIERTGNPVLQDIIDIRKLAKLESTYLKSTLDVGHIRSEIVIAQTTSGRWASRKSAWGSGGNLQNIPSGKTEVSDRVLKVLNNDKTIIKSCFVPESDDYVFLEIDLSNAETWYTAFKAKDKLLMEALRQGADTHCIVGAICYCIPAEQINTIQRNIAKRVGHGFNYGMGEKMMAITTKLPLSLVKEMYVRLKKTRPAIPEYHREVERCIIEDKCLVNAWGRKRIFFDRTPYTFIKGRKIAIISEIYKSGYSYIPQSSVPDTITNVILQFEKRKHEIEGIRVALQIHDSLLVHCLKSSIYAVIKFMWECFDIDQNPWGDPFKIPWDYSIGYNWGHMEKLPVKQGCIDYSKNTIKDKETGEVKVVPWVKIIEEIEKYNNAHRTNSHNFVYSK